MSCHTGHMAASGSCAHHSCDGSKVVGTDVLLLDPIHHICKRSCNDCSQTEARLKAGHVAVDVS